MWFLFLFLSFLWVQIISQCFLKLKIFKTILLKNVKYLLKGLAPLYKHDLNTDRSHPCVSSCQSAESLHFLRTAAAILTWVSKARQRETQFLLPDYKEIRGYLIEHSPHLLIIMLTFSLTVHILSPSLRQENYMFPDTDLPTIVQKGD